MLLVVHHYLGFRDAEAADVLGIPAGTYKSRLYRATAALRAAIEADDRVSLRPRSRSHDPYRRPDRTLAAYLDGEAGIALVPDGLL